MWDLVGKIDGVIGAEHKSKKLVPPKKRRGCKVGVGSYWQSYKLLKSVSGDKQKHGCHS